MSRSLGSKFGPQYQELCADLSNESQRSKLAATLVSMAEAIYDTDDLMAIDRTVKQTKEFAILLDLEGNDASPPIDFNQVRQGNAFRIENDPKGFCWISVGRAAPMRGGLFTELTAVKFGSFEALKSYVSDAHLLGNS